MKHILQIASKDIRQVLRDRMSLMFLLVMPIAFTLLFGFFFGGNSSSASADPRLSIGYLDLDNSRASAELDTRLGASSVLRLSSQAGENAAGLEKRIVDNSLAGAVVVPAGYGAGVIAGQGIELELIAGTSASATATIQAELQSAAARLASAGRIASIASQGNPATSNAAFSAALTAWEQPPFGVQISSSAAKEETKPAPSAVSTAQTSLGMMIQFAMAGLISAAQVLVHERKTRCMQRLLTTAVARHEILLGHFLSIFLTCLVQLSLLILFGQLVLHQDYLRQPVATLLMAVATALFIGAMGLLIGALAKGDDQAIIFSLIPMFVLAGLGGAWMPLEVTSAMVQLVGHLTPVAWAMDGFKNILVRGLDLSSIWLPAGALLGYALVFLGLAAWKFKFE